MADFLGEAIAHSAADQGTSRFPEQADINPVTLLSTSPRHRLEAERQNVQEAGELSDQEEPDPFANRQALLLLPKSPSASGLTSLRLENCSLRNPVLESLANSVRSSGIKHISLRRNRINQLGAVALAVLIRDYELSPDTHGVSSTFSHVQGHHESAPQSGKRAPAQVNSPFMETTGFRPYTADSSNSVTATANSREQSMLGTHNDARLRAGTPDMSDIYSPSSSSSMSISETEDHETSFGPDRNQGRVTVPAREASRYAEMRTRLQKQIEVLPRVGTLLTLDIRSNDIKVRYIQANTAIIKANVQFLVGRRHLHQSGAQAQSHSSSTQPE